MYSFFYFYNNSDQPFVHLYITKLRTLRQYHSATVYFHILGIYSHDINAHLRSREKEFNVHPFWPRPQYCITFTMVRKYLYIMYFKK